MRLRTKLTLIIAVASVVPIVVAALVGRELVQRRSRAAFDQLLADGQVEVQTRYRVMQQEVMQAVERLASSEDQFIGPILIGLAQGGLNDETFRRLAQDAPRVMQERGLDLLTVLDPQDRILASGHFPGQIGDTARRTALRGRGTALLPARLLEQGKPVTRLALQARRTARSSLGYRVTVVGGRCLGPRFVGQLRLRGGTEVLIQDAAGRHLAGPADWGRLGSYPSRVVALEGPGGKVAARVTLAVPDDSLRRSLQAINRTAGALVLCGLLLSLLLGLVAASRISRPLLDLADGAQRVAHGELDLQLDARGRDEVGALVQAFNQMTVDLKTSKEKLVTAERIAAWQEVARRIAHEIKNPLFPIQTSIETLQKVHRKRHPDFEEIFEESTSTILQEVQRLKTIASEFSQFARMPKPRLAPCDLGDLVRSVAGLYRSETIPVHCEIDDDLPRVSADREQLSQVLSNLIKNAQEAVAGLEAPRIRVAAHAKGGQVQVIVQDNGAGFESEVGAQIFVPYFTTKGSREGSGLGLAIAQRIVLDHGGRIEAHSDGEGRGARFEVWLGAAE